MSTRNVWVIVTCLAACMVLPARAADEAMKPASTQPGDKKSPAAKLYRFKARKTTGTGESASTILRVEDLITGRSDNVYLAKGDAELADAAGALEPGTAIELTVERQKGKPVAVAIDPSPLTDGEDRPNMYVLVDWDRRKQADGKPIMAVKLRKYGREIVAIVPLTHNKDTDDWYAGGNIDGTLSRVERGQVLEAVFMPKKSGGEPVVQNLYPYEPPERGKFIEFVQQELNGGETVAAGFKMTSKDGVTLTVTLPGVERRVKGTKFLAPDPTLLRAVQGIKPDTEVEVSVIYGTYVLRDIKILAAPTKATTRPDRKA